MTAEFHVLFTGYVKDRGYQGPGTSRIASTITFVRDGEIRAIIDPGMVPRTFSILRALNGLGDAAEQITDVILSHHHPDHTMNVALFPNARVHDFWAVYRGDAWQSRAAEAFAVSPSIRLIQTPGHTPQDVTTLISTAEGTAACTHLWWSAEGPSEDPFASDREALHRNRLRVLEQATLIIPGHGAPFEVTPDTPH